jgi:hypothetical protein
VRIFLSYAAEDREFAESLQLALAGAGHEVFFDRTSLPAGGEFHHRIRQEIERCALFVFVVSPESIAQGSYCRTELKFARERWTHPAGHVLPVLARPTDFAAIPAYLREVTIVQPEGNAAAEVLALVERDRAPHGGDRRSERRADEPRMHTQTAEVQAGARVEFGAVQYVHNVPVATPQGTVPGMSFVVPLTVEHAAGATLQLLVRFGMWGGAALLANPLERVWRDPNGLVAVWNAPRPISGDRDAVTDTQMALPYYALNLVPTNGSMVYALAFTVEAFVDDRPVAHSAPVAFQVRW